MTYREKGMDASIIIGIAVPSIAIIFNAGIQTQMLRELKRLTKDHEDRIRKLEK